MRRSSRLGPTQSMMDRSRRCVGVSGSRSTIRRAITLLGALAAWTDRVRLMTTVVVPQLHDPVMLAKALATGDMLSDGRLTVGLGVGGPP